MAVNLLEEDRLVYHDLVADTLEVRVYPGVLKFTVDDKLGVAVDRDAVETLRDSLTNWLNTGKLIAMLLVVGLALFTTGCATCSESHPCHPNRTNRSQQGPIPKPVCLYSCSDLMCSYEASDGRVIFAGYTDQVPLCKGGK